MPAPTNVSVSRLRSVTLIRWDQRAKAAARERQLLARALAALARVAAPDPAVEQVEVARLPVRGVARLDAQQLAAVARPVQRAVVVVPREAHRLRARASRAPSSRSRTTARACRAPARRRAPATATPTRDDAGRGRVADPQLLQPQEGEQQQREHRAAQELALEVEHHGRHHVERHEREHGDGGEAGARRPPRPEREQRGDGRRAASRRSRSRSASTRRGRGRARARPAAPRAPARRRPAARPSGRAAGTRRRRRRRAARARRAASATSAATSQRSGPFRRPAPSRAGTTSAAIPTACHARAGSAGSSSAIQCSPANAAKTIRTSPARGRAAARDRPRPRAPRCPAAAAASVLDGGSVMPRPHRGHDGRAAGAAGDEALAARDLEHGAAAGDRARDHEQAAARRAPEPARRAVDHARGDEHDEPAAVLRGGERGAGVVLHQREPHVRLRPGEQVGLDRRRRAGRPGSSSPQPVRLAKCTVSDAAARTAASSASCDAGRARVEHDERARVGLGDAACAPSARRRAPRSASGCATRASPRGSARRPSISVSAAAIERRAGVRA